MRISVRFLRRCRMISWPAAWGIRWVNPSTASVSPSWTVASMASARDEIRAIQGDFPVLWLVFTAAPGQGQMAISRAVGPPTMLGQEPIFTIEAELDAMMSLGPTPYGERRFVGISGGSVSGA